MNSLLNNITDFKSALSGEIQKGLPGTEVQWQMASSDRMVQNFPRTPGPDAKVAAILILLFPFNKSLYTVLMQRPEYKGVHGGQISFPGGKKELSDKNIIHTAIREAHEETGLKQEDISVISTLTPLFIPVSNMIVTPVVGLTEHKPEFRHHPGEVVFLFEAEINRLIDPSIISTRQMEIHGVNINVKFFDYDGNVIWGATAMILHELLTIIKRGNIPLVLS